MFARAKDMLRRHECGEAYIYSVASANVSSKSGYGDEKYEACVRSNGKLNIVVCVCVYLLAIFFLVFFFIFRLLCC